MKRVLFSLVAMLLFAVSGIAQTTYTMVNSASQLEAGQYILVGYDNDGNAFAMSFQKSNNRHAVAIEEVGGAITATLATSDSDSLTFEFTLEGSAGAWTIFDPLNNGYLCAPGGGNYLRTQSTLDDKGRWNITDGEEGGMFPVSNGGVEQRYMRYNISSTLFGCYKESSNVAAPVYFFKAGGDPAPPVPPCAYPTDFEVSHVDGVDVTLIWNDAPCTVRYLVLASIGDITVPTNGVPVPDGLLAKNVNSGIQTVTFRGLESNTNYNFAIFPYTGSGANILYLTDDPYPKVTATTGNIEYLLYEDFDDGLGVFFTYDAYGEQGWHQASYQGTTYAVCNGYASGAAHQNEDWLIGEVPGWTDTYFTDIFMEFRTAMKFDGDPLRVVVSGDYDGHSDPSDYEWTDITDAFDFSAGNYEWVESGKVNIIDVVGDFANSGYSWYIAFIYTSTDEAASSWEIDYVKVTGAWIASVNENSAMVIDFYPNPVRDQVSFTLESDAQVYVFDMMGRKLSEMHAAIGEAQLNVSQFENGVYFVTVRYANGSTAVSKFVKF